MSSHKFVGFSRAPVRVELRKSVSSAEDNPLSLKKDSGVSLGSNEISQDDDSLKLLRRIDEGYSQVLSQIRSEVPGMILDVTRSAWSEFDFESSSFLRVVEEKLNEYVKKEESVRVFLSSSESKMFRDYIDDSISEFSKIEILEDSSLKKGEFFIKTSLGSYDGTVDAKLLQVRRSLGL